MLGEPSFVDEVLEKGGLRRPVVATTAQFMAIPMARFAHYCANAAALATSPLPFLSPTFAASMVWHRRYAGSRSIAWLRGRVRAAIRLAANS